MIYLLNCYMGNTQFLSPFGLQNRCIDTVHWLVRKKKREIFPINPKLEKASSGPVMLCYSECGLGQATVGACEECRTATHPRPSTLQSSRNATCR